jgi:hypothetical protein
MHLNGNNYGAAHLGFGPSGCSQIRGVAFLCGPVLTI